uniref:Tudor domain-containing protein n=1 Tax=Anopheles epiroticus TaxID=199890 RepID=A0A182P6J2_9DIPT
MNDTITCERCTQRTVLPNDFGDATIALNPSYYMLGIVERKQQELKNLELYYVDANRVERQTTVSEATLPALHIKPVSQNDIGTPKRVKNLLEKAYHSYETTKCTLEKRNKSYPENVDQVIKRVNAHFVSLHNALQMEEDRVLQQVRKSFLDQRQHNEQQQRRLQTSKDQLKKLYARAKRFLADQPVANDPMWLNFSSEVKTFLESEPLKLLKREGIAPQAIFYTEKENFLKTISKSYTLQLPDLGKMMQLVPITGTVENNRNLLPAGTSINIDLNSSKASGSRKSPELDEPFMHGRKHSTSSSSRAQASFSRQHQGSERVARYNSSRNSSFSKCPMNMKKNADRDKDVKRFISTVKVTYIVNPHEFYVQDELHLESTKSLVELCQQEADAYEANLIAGQDRLDVQEGKLYLVRSEGTSTWYRALLMETLNPTLENRGPYRVQFIDYGGHETVTHGQVRPMSEELAVIGGRAIRCSLYNVAPKGWMPGDLNVIWSDDCSQMMMEFVANNKMVMFELARKSNCLVVDLFLPPINVPENKHTKSDDLWDGYYAPMSLKRMLLFSHKCVQGKEATSRNTIERIELLDYWYQVAKVQSAKRMYIPRTPVLNAYDSFDVQVTHSNSPDNFYLMPSKWKTTDFDLLQQQLAELCSAKSTFQCFLPYEGLVCGFAMGDKSNKVWFRCRIEKCLDGVCEVFVIDSGERLTVHPCDLYLLPPESAPLLKHPLAVRCRLDHIHAKNNSGDHSGGNYGIIPWTQEALDEFNQLVNTKTLRFSVKMGQFCKDTKLYGVVLYLHNKSDRETSINKLLVLEGHAECVAGMEEEINDRLLEPTEAAAASDQSKIDLKSSKLVDPRILVDVLKVVTPCEFYVRLRSNKAAMERLHQTIQHQMVESLDENVEECESGASGDCNWMVGDLCVVFTSTPGASSSEWYRARVTNVRENGLEYEVFLIDVAETVQVHRTNTARLTPKIAQIQPGSVRCRLACIGPIGGSSTWHKATLDALINSIASYDQHAISLDTVVPKESDNAGLSLPVVLWGIRLTMQQALAPQETKYWNINQLLVVRGLAHSTGRFRTFATKGAGAVEELQRFEQTIDEMMCSEYEKLQQFFRSVAAVSTDTLEGHRSGEDGNETAKTVLKYEESNVKVDIDDTCAFALSQINVAFDSIKEWPEGKRLDKTIFVGMPTHIGNDGTLFIYDVCQEPVLTRMRDIINEHVQNSTFPPIPVRFRKDEPCFVRYHVDGNFYRGKILLVIEPYRTYRVLFVDYGNEETCTMQDLRPASVCGLVPIQTNRFRLSGILPIDYCPTVGLWPEDALVVCHGLFVQKLCKIRVDAEIWSDDAWKDPNKRHLAVPCYLTLLDGSIDVRMALMEVKMFKLCSEKPGKHSKWVERDPPRRSEFVVKITNPRPTEQLETSKADEEDLLQFMKVIQAEYLKGKEFEDPNELPEEKDDSDWMNRAQLINLDLDDDEKNEQTEENVPGHDQSPGGELLTTLDTPMHSPASFESHEIETSSRLSAEEEDESIISDTYIQSDPVARCFPYLPQIKPSMVGFFAEYTNYGDGLTLHLFPHLEGHTQRMAQMTEKVQLVANSRNQFHRWQASLLEPGAACLAPYRADGLYYRAIVEEVDEEREEVRVLYVDYLNRDTVARKDLRKCPIGLRMVTLRNIMVRLAGLRTNARLRTEDVVRRLIDLLGQPFFVRVVNYPLKQGKAAVPEVELYTDCDCKTLVYQKMIDTKYFIRTTANKC